MSKKVVRWEKWADPFAQEVPKKEPDDVEDDRDYKDSYEKAEREQKATLNRYTGPVLVGPMGVIPITENNSPSKIYNFWMLHTNFNISSPVLKKLKELPGVETLDVFTRYRARIGIGKVFNDTKVRNRITKALCQEPKKEKEKEEVKKVAPKLDNLDILKRQMSQKYKFWAIVIQQNNEIKLVGGDTQEFVQNKVSETEYVKIHKSWE